MLLNASIGSPDPEKLRGSFSLATSAEPLLDGFRVIYGDDIALLLSVMALIGLIASFHTIIFAFGRQIYSLSRAGYYPAVMSLTHGRRKTPHIALFTGAGLGLAIIMTVWFVLGAEQGGAKIGATLLNMAVFGAMISYALQGISFIVLRKKMPNIERPYRSPLGIAGAAATVLIAAVTLYYQLQDAAYREGVYAALAWYLLGIVYFAVIGRHRLVLSPEEAFAITGGRHGHPETEGYGTTKL
jgi:ethanolamine permease